MADHPLAPPPPPDRKPPLSATGKPPIKRKNPTTTATNPPPNKRPNIPPPPPPSATGPGAASSSSNVQDTATSNRQDDTAFLEDLYILQTLIDHRTKKGVYPFETPDAMADFLFMWTFLGIGTEDEWKARIEKVKAKYTIESEPVEAEERKEFDLWMRIWGNEGYDEHDPDHGAVDFLSSF